jgi:hypothetical protein
MKKIAIYLSGAVLVFGFALFARTLFLDYGTTSVQDLSLKEGLFYDAKGSVFSGKIKVTSNDMDTLFSRTKATIPVELFSGLGIFQNTDTLPKHLKDSLKGIVLHISVEDGKASEQSEVYYDLKSGRDHLFNQEIEKGRTYYTSHLFNNRIRIATISFSHTALQGSSYLVNQPFRVRKLR